MLIFNPASFNLTNFCTLSYVCFLIRFGFVTLANAPTADAPNSAPTYGLLAK